jgi:hypothetical protein
MSWRPVSVPPTSIAFHGGHGPDAIGEWWWWATSTGIVHKRGGMEGMYLFVDWCRHHPIHGVIRCANHWQPSEYAVTMELGTSCWVMSYEDQP